LVIKRCVQSLSGGERENQKPRGFQKEKDTIKEIKRLKKQKKKKKNGDEEDFSLRGGGLVEFV